MSVDVGREVAVDPRGPLHAMAYEVAQPRGGDFVPADGGESSTLLWSSIPANLAEAFRPHLDGLVAEVIAEIRKAVPEYSLPLEGIVGQHLAEGVEQAVHYCSDLTRNQGDRSHWEEVFRLRGRIEFLEGRTLDVLQTAYRVGGRAAWRYIADVFRSMDVPADLICLGAEAIMAYIDELSRLSLEGYAAEEARAVGTVERRRRRLLKLILAQPSVTPQAIAELADAAGWVIPERLTVVALEPRQGQRPQPALALEAEVLVDLDGSEPCLITASPERLLPDLAAALPGWRAVASPAVPFAAAATALRWARRALRLQRNGIIAPRPVTWCCDHLSTLWLFADEPLISELARHSLAPLNDLTPNKRARLAETLLVWLETRGSAAEIAKILGVHQQTVRYRLHQLEELFGTTLNDPDTRFDLEIALRAQRMRDAQQDGDGATEVC